MSFTLPLRPSPRLTSIARCVRHEKTAVKTLSRGLTTDTFAYRKPTHPVSGKLYTGKRAEPSRLKKFTLPPARPSIKKTCAVPGTTFNEQELARLDPSGSRRRLVARGNADRLKVGDVALVRFRTGDPFAGLVLNVRHRGPDSGILLRNQLTRVGTEMWVKIFSPTVTGIEIVQRSERRIRRARAYYFRKPKHDRGSLANLVDSYVRQSKLLGRNTGESTATKKK